MDWFSPQPRDPQANQGHTHSLPQIPPTTAARSATCAVCPNRSVAVRQSARATSYSPTLSSHLMINPAVPSNPRYGSKLTLVTETTHPTGHVRRRKTASSAAVESSWTPAVA